MGDGCLQTSWSEHMLRLAASHDVDRPACRQLDWILLDSLKGGSGESFDWQQLQPPVELCSSGWLLAGGLGPHNVAGAG
jgi:phosphoribosylanthranilate isomerase